MFVTGLSERPQALQQFNRNNETRKNRKDDTNIHVLNCCVESLLLKQNAHIRSMMDRVMESHVC